MCHIDDVLLVTGMQMEMGIALVPNEYYCYGVRFVSIWGQGLHQCSWVNKNRNVNDRQNMGKNKEKQKTYFERVGN